MSKLGHTIHFMHRVYNKTMSEAHHVFTATAPLIVEHQMGLALIIFGGLLIVFGIELMLTEGAVAAAIETVQAASGD